jgi:excisionase family DNA binding protein
MVKKKVEETPADLITYTEAARLLGYNGVSGVSKLVERGRLRGYEMFDKPLVSRADVKAYKPEKGGRGRKVGG